VVAEAENGEQAYQSYCEHLPDVAVMDLSMPGMGGLEAARRILSRYSMARLLVFSMHESAAFASQALKAGARGYVAKTGAPDELLVAIREVMHGKTWISPNVAHNIALQSLVGERNPMQQLSAREFEVFRLLAEGHGTEEIGERLKISQKTVANNYTLIKQKLGISTSVELIRLAMQHGVVAG
jgi:two-component system, NarL family, invasion response regulator UvrY